jgi:hypothetical protein
LACLPLFNKLLGQFKQCQHHEVSVRRHHSKTQNLNISLPRG